MSGNSNIEWTQKTWNPVTGCTKVSPGCAHCYAETIDHRFDHDKVGKLPWAFPASRGGRGVTLHPERLGDPLRWRKPSLVFVNSMSDLFHEDVPDDFIARCFVAMMLAKNQTFQVLTKRPDRMANLLPRLKALMRDEMYRAIGLHYDEGEPEPWYFFRQGRHHGAPREYWIERWYSDHTDNDLKNPHLDWRNWPLRNVWMGVSVENQLWADRRIPYLLETPAAVRFLSCEPLLGPVDLSPWLTTGYCANCGDGQPYGRCCDEPIRIDDDPLDWVITGGESGPKARPMHPDWARSLRDQCQAAGVPFFFKQWGAWRPLEWEDMNYDKHEFGYSKYQVRRLEPADMHDYYGPDGQVKGQIGTMPCVIKVGKKSAGRLLDGRTWDEMPEVSHAR